MGAGIRGGLLVVIESALPDEIALVPSATLRLAGPTCKQCRPSLLANRQQHGTRYRGCRFISQDALHLPKICPVR